MDIGVFGWELSGEDRAKIDGIPQRKKVTAQAMLAPEGLLASALHSKVGIRILCIEDLNIEDLQYSSLEADLRCPVGNQMSRAITVVFLLHFLLQ